MKSNADVDFEISGKDMGTLKRAEHIKDYWADGYYPVFAKGI